MSSDKSSRLPALCEEAAGRYWEQVSKNGTPRGCWLWTGSKNKKGYGRFFVNGHHYYAHRLAWAMAGRETPRELLICHTCDNPACVNPDHLIMADAATNNRDAKLKRNLAGIRKPEKPHPDFPLFPHATRRWAKKIRGRTYYFGPWTRDADGGGQAALERWLDVKDDLLAGRQPQPKADGLSVSVLCDHFLNHKRTRLLSGELSQRSFDDYLKTCAALVAAFGKTRLVVHLSAFDFDRLRADFTKRLGPVALGNAVGRVRSVFRYGHEAGLLQSPMRFGPGFKKPSAKVLRQTRQKRGPRLFEAAELRSILAHATGAVRAMVLLGVNGALGNTDLALLPIHAANLEAGILDYPRPKTAIPRTIPLWPETVAAIRDAIAERREPKDPDEACLLFIGPRGESYVGNRKGFRVHQTFSRLLEKAGVKGRSFYDLRRTFQTIAEGSRDLSAVQAIMGHAPAAGDMSAIYRQRIDADRLRAVVDHVRGWLFGDGGEAGTNNCTEPPLPGGERGTNNCTGNGEGTDHE